MINTGTVSYIRGLLLLKFLVSSSGTGSTGNSLMTCAACQTAQVKFDSWDCNVNCDVMSSDNDITVTSTLIRELKRKLDVLNSTMMTRVEKIEEKNKELEEAKCAFSVHLVESVDINGEPVRFGTVDLNVCDGYDNTTGIFTPTLNGMYFLPLHGVTNHDNSEFRILRNDDVLCQSWITQSAHGDTGTCSVTAILSVGDSVRVSGSADNPGRLWGGHAGFTGFLIRP